jgi:hypothetical protein
MASGSGEKSGATTTASDDGATLDTTERWSQRGEDLAFNELDTIRAAADKWSTTIAALTGASGILTALQGRDALSKLVGWLQVVTVVLLVVALIVAVWAIWKGALAAQGSPKRTFTDADSVRQAYEKAADDAASNLAWSRKAALWATGLFAVAVLLLGIGPGAASSDQRAVVIRAGSATCGVLATTTDGALTLSTKKGTPGSVLNDVTSLTMVESCP